MILKQIGVIKSRFKDLNEAPRQGTLSGEIGEVVVFEEYAEGLKGIENYRYLILLYWMHLSNREVLFVKERNRGVFATRSPNRPNPIGFSVVKLVNVNGNVLTVKGVDAIDGTPLLDIKPYYPEVDCIRD